MKKWYLVEYEEKEHNGIKDMPILAVVDTDVTLENGNNKVVKVLIGSYATEVLRILTEEDAEYGVE